MIGRCSSVLCLAVSGILKSVGERILWNSCSGVMMRSCNCVQLCDLSQWLGDDPVPCLLCCPVWLSLVLLLSDEAIKNK